MRITKSKEERRAEFIDIAGRLFEDKGYENVKVSDIVKEAKVAQGTFYYHFKTKEDVLFSVLERTIEGMAHYLKSLASNESIDVQRRFEQILSQLFSPLATDSAIYKLMENTDKIVHHQLDSLRRSLIAPIIVNLICEGVEKGNFRPLGQPEIISMIVFDGINEQMHKLYEDKQAPEQLMVTVAGITELLNLVLNVQLNLQESHRGES